MAELPADWQREIKREKADKFSELSPPDVEHEQVGADSDFGAETAAAEGFPFGDDFPGDR